MLDSKKDDFQTIVFFREDLRRDMEKKKLKDIEYRDIQTGGGKEFLCRASLILFIDKNYQTKILKNRWGNQGIVK